MGAVQPLRELPLSPWVANLFRETARPPHGVSGAQWVHTRGNFARSSRQANTNLGESSGSRSTM